MIAALYVDGRGCYANLPGVDVWDVERVYAHAPLSALMLGRRIKALEAKMAEIQRLAKS